MAPGCVGKRSVGSGWLRVLRSDVRPVAAQLARAAIRSAVPREATEAITYRIPTFKYNGGLVAFAAFSNHCSLFPMSYAVIGAFKKELKGFEVSKGTIRFPVDKPLPATLVKKIVKARIAENERRKRP